MSDLLDGPGSELFEAFLTLVSDAFLSVRGSPWIRDAVLAAVAAFADSDLPCFKYKDDVLVRLKGRFMPGITNKQVFAPLAQIIKYCCLLCGWLQARERFKQLAVAAAHDWTTPAYDGVQKLQNNIYSDKWK